MIKRPKYGFWNKWVQLYCEHYGGGGYKYILRQISMIRLHLCRPMKVLGLMIVCSAKHGKIVFEYYIQKFLSQSQICLFFTIKSFRIFQWDHLQNVICREISYANYAKSLRSLISIDPSSALSAPIYKRVKSF